MKVGACVRGGEGDMCEGRRGGPTPFEARLSFVPVAMKVGLRSEMGLALMILPPTACIWR